MTFKVGDFAVVLAIQPRWGGDNMSGLWNKNAGCRVEIIHVDPDSPVPYTFIAPLPPYEKWHAHEHVLKRVDDGTASWGNIEQATGWKPEAAGA